MIDLLIILVLQMFSYLYNIPSLVLSRSSAAELAQSTWYECRYQTLVLDYPWL